MWLKGRYSSGCVVRSILCLYSFMFVILLYLRDLSKMSSLLTYRVTRVELVELDMLDFDAILGMD